MRAEQELLTHALMLLSGASGEEGGAEREVCSPAHRHACTAIERM